MLSKYLYVIFFVTFPLILIFIWNPILAKAGGDYKQETIDLALYAIPDDAVYIDILMQINENDSNYTPENTDNLSQLDFDYTNLVNYNSNGYVSLSAHYDRIYTYMKIDRENYQGIDGYNIFAPYVNSYPCEIYPIADSKESEKSEISSSQFRKEQFISNMTHEYCNIKLVLLDLSGNILKETSPFSIEQNETKLLRTIRYYAASDHVDVEYYSVTPVEEVRREYTNLIVKVFLTIAVIIMIIFKLICKTLAKYR